MRKLILAVLGVLLMAVGSHAQGTPYQLDPPAPNAILRVCSFPVTGGNPCSNPTTIYSDSALTQVIAQPVQLGDSGNLIFYYSSGPLMLQLTGSVNRSILVAGGGGGGTPGGASHDIQCNVSSAFAPCGSASGAFTSNGSVVARTETGTFLAGTNYFYNEAFVSGETLCDPNTVISKVKTIISASSYNYTDGFTSCIQNPSALNTDTHDESNAISGYVINNNSHQQGSFGSGIATMAANVGSAYCIASNTECEGAVQFAMDDSSLSNVVLVGNEVGAFPQNTGDSMFGYLFSGFGNVQPAFDKEPAFDVHIGGAGSNRATTGFQCEAGAILAHGPAADCVGLYPISASGTNIVSSSVHLESLNGSSAAIDGYLYQAVDNGNAGVGIGPRLIFLPSSGSAASFTTGVLIMAGVTTPVSGCSLSSASGGAAGKFVSGTSGTCTVTITLPVTTFVGWSCTANDITTPADVLHQTASTTSTATISGTTVSGDTINYSCVGF